MAAVADDQLVADEARPGLDEQAAGTTVDSNGQTFPLDVVYCGVCSFPPEFCEFSDDYEKCKLWMKTNAPDYFDKLVQHVEDLSLAEDGAQTKKPKTKSEKPIKKKVRFENPQRVTVGTTMRGKRKTVTVVSGLGTFDIDLKKASKMFAQQFSCGSSVSGEGDISIQGDVVDDVIEFIKKKFDKVTRDLIKDVGELKR